MAEPWAVEGGGSGSDSCGCIYSRFIFIGPVLSAAIAYSNRSLGSNPSLVCYLSAWLYI